MAIAYETALQVWFINRTYVIWLCKNVHQCTHIADALTIEVAEAAKAPAHTA
jgi:hypothetical protein